MSCPPILLSAITPAAPPSCGAAMPTDPAEAIRRSAANIPGYGSTDIFFPSALSGKWKAERTVISISDPSVTKTFQYEMRFIRSIEDNAVVADRAFNQAELDAALGRPVASTSWTETNPNDLRIVYENGSKKEIKTTKRAVFDLSETTVSSSEFQRLTEEDSRGIPRISARRVVTKWKIATDDNIVDAIELIYDEGGGDPLAGPSTSGSGPSVISKSRIRLRRAA